MNVTFRKMGRFAMHLHRKTGRHHLDAKERITTSSGSRKSIYAWCFWKLSHSSLVKCSTNIFDLIFFRLFLTNRHRKLLRMLTAIFYFFVKAISKDLLREKLICIQL